MTPLQKKFTRVYAKELLSVAKGDLESAKVLIDHPKGRPENIFFLLQQTVEKSIKSALCHLDIAIPLTHDIGALLSMLPAKVSQPPNSKALLGLTEFASIRRYEEGKYEYSNNEIKLAHGAAKKVILWATKIIQTK